MPINTPNYLLEAFLDGDLYSALADKRRFTIIDNHLYRISEIIGDGRINGWEIGTGVFPGVTVSHGSGIIDGYYINTFDDQIFNLTQNGNFYFYAQRRIGIIGSNGPKSDVKSIRYVDSGPPDDITSVNISSPDPFSVVIEFSPVSNVDLDHYEILRRDGGTGDFNIISTTKETTFTDSVDEFTQYDYQIYSVDQSGNRSTNPAIASITTDLSDISPPNPIDVLMLSSKYSINILWSRPPTMEIDQINSWKISYVELDSEDVPVDSTRTDFLVNSLMYSDRIDDLKIGQKYQITLHTVDLYNRESSGISKNIIPQPNPGPNDPIVITYSQSKSDESGIRINLSWTDGDTPYYPVKSRRYKIYTTIVGQVESDAINVPVGYTEEQVSLIPYNNASEYRIIPENTLVTFRIVAVDDQEYESIGNYVRFVTDIVSPTLKLESVQSAFDLDAAKIRITWDNRKDTYQVNIIILDTDLEDPYITDVIVVNTIVISSVYEFSGVEINHKYKVYLTPYNVAGDAGPISSKTVFTTSGIVGTIPKPSPPDRIEIKPNDREISITWNDSMSNLTTEYRIYKKIGDISTKYSDWEMIDQVPRSLRLFTDYGLENDQLYSYYLTGVDIYGNESPHLLNGVINLAYVQGTPKKEGSTTEPDNVELSLTGGHVLITWDSLLEEFDGFSIYRSHDNLHSWTKIADVSRDTFSFLDIELPMVDGTVIYYMISKTTNDADIIVQSFDVLPEHSIYLGAISTSGSGFIGIDIKSRRDIKDMLDPISEYTNKYLLTHKHSGIENNPDRIDLNPKLVITKWSTNDGKTFTTQEDIRSGTSYVLKINGRMPSVLYEIDVNAGNVTFINAIADVDPSTGTITGVPDIELTVFGIEEVQGVLPTSKFNNIHARQIGYGLLQYEQIPELNHEGRIFESVYPDRYLLERYSNHTFSIPQYNKDSGKNFGNGTAFYSVTDSDGEIQTLVDWDIYNDDEKIMFQKPSHSNTTLHNLKLNTKQEIIESFSDNAVYDSSGTWYSNPTYLYLGDNATFQSDVYLRFPVNFISSFSLISATITFAVHESFGNQVVVKISYLDPAAYSDSLNLDTDAARFVADKGSTIWNPQNLADMATESVDVTSLISQFIQESDYAPGNHIILKFETISSGVGHYRSAYSFNDITLSPTLDLHYTVDIAEVTSSIQFQNNKSYHLQFEFEDNSTTRWVRVTTSGSEILPNPIINLKKRLRFKVYLPSRFIRMGVGIREIPGESIQIGENGGVSGAIEWVNVPDFVLDESNVVPVGQSISPGIWHDIDIDFSNTNVLNFENGNGYIDSRYGVLEHLAFTVDPENPSSGPFDVYINKIEQSSDLLVSGTSNGIQISDDFGSSWKISRLTETPVHKFYKSQNSNFLWAISSTEVLLSTDPVKWYTIKGAAGVQSIRDIVEDSVGNIYVSTERGVFVLDISRIYNFSLFEQTQPITAFTTDCYGMYHNNMSSGIDEIWVSTEFGIYKTSDTGSTWEDTGLRTFDLPVFQFQNTGTSQEPNIIGMTKKHILRKRHTDNQFYVVSNFDNQHGISDNWTFEYFSEKLYVSNGGGVYVNDDDLIFTPGIVDIYFSKVMPQLDKNGHIATTFCLNKVMSESNTYVMFAGQENRLFLIDSDGKVHTRSVFYGELPSFYTDDIEQNIGYTYNTFNGVISFREYIGINQIVSSATLPRRIFHASNGGWALTNPMAEVFIYIDGNPKWLFFQINNSRLLSEIQSIRDDIENLPDLDDFNSILPQSQEYRDKTIEDINTILSGGENGTTSISNNTIILFLDDFTRFKSLLSSDISTSVRNPEIILSGISKSEAPATSRGTILELSEDFLSSNSVGINISAFSGIIDFESAYANATTPEDRDLFSFDKFDHMNITVFNSNIKNTGELTHRQIEDKMEEVGTGLSENMSRSFYTNLIRTGIFVELNNHFLFDRYNVSNIQSKFYAAHTASWYDMVNSTIDYDTVVDVNAILESRFANVIMQTSGDPYLPNKIWIGTDKYIAQYDIISDPYFGTDALNMTGIIIPGNYSSMSVWDLWEYNGKVYAVASDPDQSGHIYYTSDYGTTWDEIETTNLPNEIYSFRMINNTKIVGTQQGVYYCDNDLGEWYAANVALSKYLSGKDPINAFESSIWKLIHSNFLICESDRWFYTSGSGREFLCPGRMSENKCSSVNSILRFKNLTWIATNKGLYNDANSILSDNVQFGLQIIETTEEYSLIPINDITNSADSVYVCSSNEFIYRFLDGIWSKYFVPDFGPIHKLFYCSTEIKQLLIAISYDKSRVIDVTPGNGVFG